jgi:hypothetical protein
MGEEIIIQIWRKVEEEEERGGWELERVEGS